MDEVVIRHWVETPIRYQNHFIDQDLEINRLDHSLYALPGPASSPQKKDKQVALSTDDVKQNDSNEERLKFQVLLDVVQFRPEDVIIQIFEGWLLIKAQHGPRMDEHGFIARSFTRQYQLPDGIKTNDLNASFCHDGILVVETKTFSKE